MAPAAFSDLCFYRDMHLRHHMMLGLPGHDPDYLPPPKVYVLPQAQALFAQTSAYRAEGRLCRSYFVGPDSVVSTWRAPLDGGVFQ